MIRRVLLLCISVIRGDSRRWLQAELGTVEGYWFGLHNPGFGNFLAYTRGANRRAMFSTKRFLKGRWRHLFRSIGCERAM